MKLYILLIFALTALACASPVEMLGGPTSTQTAIPSNAPTYTAMPPSGTAETSGTAVPTKKTMPPAEPTIPAMPCAAIVEENVNLRDAGDYNANVLAWLKQGERVTVLKKGEWWQVQTGNQTGFVRGDLLEEASCP